MILKSLTEHKLLETFVFLGHPVKLVKFKKVMCKISKIQASYKHHPRSIEIKKKVCPEAFSDKLDQELSNYVATNFLLNRKSFDDVFDQFVNIIEKTIDKHALL